MESPSYKPKNVVHLTTKQGLLLIAAIVLGFGGLIIWTATRYPKSFEGTVVAGATTLRPFGCTTQRAANTLTIPLEEDPRPEGFREENRGLIIADGSTQGTTSSPRPVEVSTISWRDENQVITPMTCTNIEDDFTVFSKRRGGQRRVREDLWSGSIKATCQAPMGEIKIDLKMENCDW